MGKQMKAFFVDDSYRREFVAGPCRPIHPFGCRCWFAVLVFGLLMTRGTSGLAAAPARMLYPVDVAAAADGTLYVADTHLPGIWKITEGKLSVYYKAAKQFRAPLHAVRCLAIDPQGNLLAGDSATREVYRFSADGKPHALTGGKIGTPMGIAVRASGEILVSDLELHTLWKVPAAGGAPTKLCALESPIGICLDNQDRLWVVSRIPPLLRRVSADGKKVDTVLPGRPFDFPHDVVVDAKAVAYVTDGYGKAVWRVADGKKPEKLIEGKPLVNPVGITLQNDQIIVSDSRAAAVFKISPDGKATQCVGK